MVSATVVDFDLKWLAGVYLDNGEPYQPVSAGAPAGMAAATVAAGSISVYQPSTSPNSNQHLRINLTRENSPDLRSDLWRLNTLHEYARTGGFDFTRGQRLVAFGEWETAVITSLSAGQFVGGLAHGEQKATSAALLINGSPHDLTEAFEGHVRQLDLFQTSDLYEFGSAGASRLAVLNTRWSVTRDYIDLFHTIRWELVRSIPTAYLTMCPWLRLDAVGTPHTNAQISDTARRSPLFQAEDVSDAGFTEIKSASRRIILTGPTGYALDLEIVSVTGAPALAVNVSTNAAYNKIYVNFADGSAVAPGEEWSIHSRYRITTNN